MFVVLRLMCGEFLLAKVFEQEITCYKNVQEKGCYMNIDA